MYKRILIFGSNEENNISILQCLTHYKDRDATISDTFVKHIDDENSLIYYIFGSNMSQNNRNILMKIIDIDLILFSNDHTGDVTLLDQSLLEIQGTLPVIDIDAKYLQDESYSLTILSSIHEELYPSISARRDSIPLWMKVWILSMLVILFLVRVFIL
jgi:hypothetical protein